MSQFDGHPPPWIPDYAFPDEVLQEPLARGADVTPWLPRGYADPDPDLPGSWGHGYAVPENVAEEGLREDPDVTSWLPRGTKPAMPSPLDGDGDREETIEEKLERLPRLGDEGDPIGKVAYASAAYLVRSLHREVPKSYRLPALRSLLEELEEGLYGRAKEKAEHYRDEVSSDKEAMILGIADAMTEGIAHEIYEAGQSGFAPQDGIMAFGMSRDRQDQAALGFFGTIKDAATTTWDKTTDAASKAWDWTKTAGRKIGEGTCWLVNREHADEVGAIAGASIGTAVNPGTGTAIGGATGSAGTQALRQVCPEEVEELPPELRQELVDAAVEPDQGFDIPWVPIAAGLGVVALAAVLTR